MPVWAPSPMKKLLPGSAAVSPASGEACQAAWPKLFSPQFLMPVWGTTEDEKPPMPQCFSLGYGYPPPG